MKDHIAIMAGEDELERYQRLLQDWKLGPGPVNRPPASRPTESISSQTGQNIPYEPRPEPLGTLAAGSILLLNDRTLAVYQRAVSEREYHLLLILTAAGGVKQQGLSLQAHKVDELGKLPHRYLEQLQNEMKWERDLIVFHCYRYQDVRRIPDDTSSQNGIEPTGYVAPAVGEASPAPNPPPQTVMPTRRGQRLQIKFGNNLWDAVYWGRDGQGHVVAHQTHQKWTLMHLDLERFANGLVIDPHVDENLIGDIERALLEEAVKS